MKIRIFDSNNNLITQIDGVVNPQVEFDTCYREMYNAVTWEEYTDPQPTEAELVAQENAKIKAQIAELESRQFRATREMLLGYDGAKEYLESIDLEIVALREQLK